MKNLIGEIHRRSLWQVLGIYAAASWVVLQIVDTLAGALGLPEWSASLALFLLIIGLPIVLATAFLQQGMKTKEPESPAESLADAGEVPPAPPIAPGGAAGMFTWKNAVMGGIAATAIWGLVALAWVLRGGGQALPVEQAGFPGAATPLQARVAAIAERANQDLTAVAVLPFADQGSDDEYAFFADGVHEDILTHLSKVGGILVMARGAVMEYRDSELSIAEIAYELSVDAIVQGTVRRVRDQVRITAELVDPGNAAQLWTEQYDRSLDDIFAVQSEIAVEIVGALQAELSPEEAARIAAVPTADLTAYELYQEGRQAYYEYVEEDNERAIELFKAATDRDPEFGLAWAGLADAYSQTVIRFGAPNAWRDTALATAQKAVELTPEEPWAHKALGLANMALGRPSEVIAANQRALELDPNNPDALSNLGVGYQIVGRPADALPLQTLSQRLSPRTVTAEHLASNYTHLDLQELASEWIDLDTELWGETPTNNRSRIRRAYASGDRDSVRAAVVRLLAFEPEGGGAHLLAARMSLWAGDLDLAEPYAKEVFRLSEQEGRSGVKNANTVLGEIALLRGDAELGRELLERSREQLIEVRDGGNNTPALAFQFAMVHALLDEREEALDALEDSVEKGEWRPTVWDNETAIESVRADPRFITLRGRVQEHYEAQRAQVLAQLDRPSLPARSSR